VRTICVYGGVQIEELKFRVSHRIVIIKQIIEVLRNLRYECVKPK
jgi:hypothetical protein